jgi:hypothetical protein
MMAELQGQIERITFTNEENGFTIAKVKVPGRQDLVCVVGNLMAPMPGEVIKKLQKYLEARRQTKAKMSKPAATETVTADKSKQKRVRKTKVA